MSDYLAKKKVSRYLPPGVITLILRRLPVESVVRCTAVCKTWYALIKHPSFISNHLQAASLRDDLLLLRFTIDEREFYQLRHDNDAFEAYKQFHLPFECECGGVFGVFRFIGTCNGLICLADGWDGSSDIILWNPSIHKHLVLPKCDLTFIGSDENVLGFGYDSASDDYKVLLVSVQGNNPTEVWVFSLNRNSWTRFGEVCPKHSCLGARVAAFVRGALHWPGFLQPRLFYHMILAFDLSTEKFRVMNYPESLVHFAPQMSVIKYEESIAVVTSGSFEDINDEQLELWVMKEYGVDSSWTMVLHSIDENGNLVFDASLDHVFGVRKNGEVLFKVHENPKRERELATLNLNCHHQQEHKRQLKRLFGKGDGLYDLFVGSYVESLVLLDKGEKDAEGQSDSE